MEDLKYTPRIIKLIQSNQTLAAIKEAKNRYGIDLPEAKEMIDSYRPGDTSYNVVTKKTVSEMGNNPPLQQTPAPIITKNQRFHIACPNCGSTQIHKSIGGKAEHAALWAGTKLVKSQIPGANLVSMGAKTLLGKDENDYIKNEVSFQQVCDYCHHSFHAKQSQIDAGAYSMGVERAKQLTDAYNVKLEANRRKLIGEIEEKVSKYLLWFFFYGIIGIIAILVYLNCNMFSEGMWGIPQPTFALFIVVILGPTGIIGFFSMESYYSDAKAELNSIKTMSIQQYAKDHRA